MKKTKIKFALKSWKGKRQTNQDVLVCGYNKQQNFCAVICDGIGSLLKSDIASKITANLFIDEFIKTNEIVNPTQWFKETLVKVFEKFKKYSKLSMGSTLALLLIINDKFYCFNIGDTRIYLMQKNKETHLIKQYTYDHNYRNYLISKETSAEDLLRNKHLWNSLTNFIDPSQPNRAKFDLNSGTIKKKTYFLLCTDGLYAYVRNNTKYQITTNSFCPMSLKLTMLMSHAKKNGSDDNISGMIVYVK